MTSIAYHDSGPQNITKASASSDTRNSIVKEFEWATTDLQSVVAELAARLQPVLAVSYDSMPGPPSEPMPEVSEARSRLHDLHSTTAALRALLERLEV